MPLVLFDSAQAAQRGFFADDDDFDALAEVPDDFVFIPLDFAAVDFVPPDLAPIEATEPLFGWPLELEPVFFTPTPATALARAEPVDFVAVAGLDFKAFAFEAVPPRVALGPLVALAFAPLRLALVDDLPLTDSMAFEPASRTASAPSETTSPIDSKTCPTSRPTPLADLFTVFTTAPAALVTGPVTRSSVLFRFFD